MGADAYVAPSHWSNPPFLIDIANAARRIAFAQHPAEPEDRAALDAPRMVMDNNDRDHKRPQETDPPIPEDFLSHIHMSTRNYFRSGDF